MENLTAEYRYTTVVGVYAFPKLRPYAVRHETMGGMILANASTFTVLASGVVPFSIPQLLNVTDSRYRVRYTVLSNISSIGTVTITYDFRDDAPPKSTAELEQTGGPPLSLAWVTITSDTVAWNESARTDFSALDPPKRVETPALRLQIGPNTDPSAWTHKLTMDWGDAGNGSAFVGRIEVGGLEGAAVVVKFPPGMTRVDPILVGTSTAAAATDYSIQRKTFAYAGTYWAFWYDGSNIAYSSSPDGVTWNAKMTTVSGAITYGFDVDQRDGVVLASFVPSSLLSIRILKGIITGTFITWSGPFTLDAWTIAQAGPPTSVVGSDGRFLVAVPRRETASQSKFYVYRSDSPGSVALPLSLSSVLSGVPSDSAARVLALSNGGAYLVVSTKGFTNIQTYRYTSIGWGAMHDYPAFSLSSSEDRGSILSAVALPDDRVRLVYRDIPGALQTVRVDLDDTLLSGTTLDVGSVYYISNPTISRDPSGYSYVFYRSTEPFQQLTIYHVFYTRQRPSWDGLSESWTTPEEPFASVTVWRGSPSAFTVSVDRVGVVFTEGAAAPYSVKFEAVPTPLTYASQTGQPWDRQGISPFQTYFHQMSEYVSPGSGLLTVKQTDMVIPGRHLNLEISRVFLTPRSFWTPTGVPPKSLFEDYNAANLGKGWRLNFPWLSDQYLHLWDGQMYVVNWPQGQGTIFENHDGQHFVLVRLCVSFCFDTFRLYTNDGTQYEFNFAKQLTSIKDLSGNQITFAYASGRLTTITDTIGRTVSLVYNGDSTLHSVTSGSQVVSYTYQTVGGLTLLNSVLDTLGRETRFEHTDARSPYLMTAIQYPTGARNAYTWSDPAIQVGPDLTGYYVTLQNTMSPTGGSIRSNSYSYAVVSGRVSYANVSTSDAGVQKGFTTQSFDSIGHKTTTIQWDMSGASPARLGKQVSWFDPVGSVGQTDTYPGVSTTPQTTVTQFDEWGNLVYSRDPSGHERFASYVNTRRQGGFFAPGRLEKTQSGLLFFDDFEDRDLSDWTSDTSGGTVGLDYATFESLPPALKIAHTGGPTGVGAATHVFTPQTVSFVVEVVVRAEETSRQHYVLLRAGTSARVYVALRDNGFISWWDGSTWNDIAAAPYQAQQWYRIAFSVNPTQSTYDIGVNGQWVKLGALMTGTGTIDRVSLQASCSGCGSATTYVDLVKVYQNFYLTVTGLQGGQIVKFSDPYGRVLQSVRVQSTTAIFTLSIGVFPYGTITILDPSWNVEFTSPTHEFWGGEFWAYVPPWPSMALARTRSGFLRYATMYLDDYANRPTATYVSGEDGWDWGPYDLPVLGSDSHRSKLLTSTHQHSFQDASTVLTPVSQQFHIQYIFIPENEYPSEIMLQFRDSSNSWEHRAFWGADLVPFGSGPGPAHQPMSGLPGSSGRWLMLVVQSDHVATNALLIEGISYTLFGGRATWDFSALGDSDTGSVTVTGLTPGWTVGVELVSPFVDVGSVAADGSGVARVCVYCGGFPISYPRAFPLDGYIYIKNQGSTVYRSPVLPLSGGDVYAYAATNFYPNDGIGPSIVNFGPRIHDRMVASLEFQTGRGAVPEIRQETHLRYTVTAGLLDRTKAWDGAFWRETSLSYDATNGDLTQATDPLSNSVSYSYSPTYSAAFVTQVTDAYGNLARSTYDPFTGRVLAGKNPRGYLTRYGYDSVGRTTTTARFDLPTASDVLYLDMEWTVEEASPRLEDLSGNVNHGTISGAKDTPGRIGRARDFSGTSQYVRVPRAVTLEPARITVGAWVYPRTVSATMDVIDKSYPDSTGSGYVLLIQSDGSVQFTVYDGDTTPITASSAAGVVAPNGWYHIGGTYDGTYVRVYVYGVERGTAAFSGAISFNDANRDMWIGSSYDGTGRYFNGVIDEVRVFNRALSSGEVATLSAGTYGLLSSTVAVFDDGLNAVTLYEPTTKTRTLHLDMETLVNSMLEDLSGHGSHASISGTTPVPSGKFGGARDFTGVLNDLVSVPDRPALHVSEAITVSAWVKPKGAHGGGYGGVWFDQATSLRSRILVANDGSVLAQFRIGSVDQSFATAAGLVPQNQWTHIGYTFDGFTERIYVNGVERANEARTGALAISTLPRLIGRGYNTPPSETYFFNGDIDEVAVLDRALAATEVSALWQGTESGFYQTQYFDSLGRTTQTLRRDLFSSSLSSEAYTYNFLDKTLTDTLRRTSTASYTTTYAYDFPGRPKSALYPGTPQALTVTYDDASRTRTVLAENGRKVQYLFDVAGRTTTVREYYDAVNYYSTSNSYDEVGNLVGVTNPLSQVTAHSYDALNRLTKTTYPDTTKYEQYTYDAVGNVRTRRDRAGIVTTYNYDNLYRLSSIDYPGTDQDVTLTYDSNGNTKTVLNPTALVAYEYDGLERPKTETDTIATLPFTVGYLYDAANRLTQLTYPDASVVTYGYDSVGRTRDVRSGGTTLATFSYYDDNLVKDASLNNGVLESFSYNGRGWSTAILDTAGPSSYLDLAYSSYDNSGNILAIGGTTQAAQAFTYDRFDRLKTASGGFGSQLYDYDASGNRKRLDTVFLRPNGAGSTTQWSKSGSGGSNWDRVSEATPDGESTYVYTSTVGNIDFYALQDNSQAGTINAVTVTAVARAEWSTSCDPNCLAAFKLRIGGSATDVSPVKYVGSAYETISHTWTTKPGGGSWTDSDLDGLQAGVELTSGGTVSTVRVTQVFVTANVGDSVVYTYADGATGMNTLSSLTKNGVTTFFGYDPNGNLNSKTGPWTYEWSYENLMTKALLGGAQQQAYLYDGLGRRVIVEGTQSSIWTMSVYSGMDAVFEKDQGGAITKYVYANGMRIAKITSSGAFQYYLGDHLGSTRKILDASRNTVFSAEYEPFGKPYLVSGSEAYKYTSEKHDDPTGLVYLRARQYDPEGGRFVSADPVLGSPSAPQTLNRYAYVVNNPLSFVDPSGECAEAPPLWVELGTLGFAGLPSAICRTAEWYGGASEAERAGFWRGIAVALVIGLVVGLACVTVVGCAPAVALAWGMGAVLLGTMAGAYVYASTVRSAGETPTREGLGHTMYWSGWSSAAGFGIGVSAAKRFGLGPPERTPGGRVLSGDATTQRGARGVSLENIDEAIDRGNMFYDPLRNSKVSVINRNSMQTRVQFRGQNLVVPQDMFTGRVITVYSGRVLPRFIPWSVWYQGWDS